MLFCSLEKSGTSVDIPKDDVLNAYRMLKKCSQGTFLSVTELSSGGQKLSGLATVDMVHAFSSCELSLLNKLLLLLLLSCEKYSTNYFVG